MHCPKNERNIRQCSALAKEKCFCDLLTFSTFWTGRGFEPDISRAYVLVKKYPLRFILSRIWNHIDQKEVDTFFYQKTYGFSTVMQLLSSFDLSAFGSV